MGLPGPPGADLVVVESGLAFGLLKRFLDMPTAARDPGQVHQSGSARAVADVVGDLELTFAVGCQQAPRQQPVPTPGLPVAVDANARPVVQARPVGSGPDRQPLPRLRRQRRDQVVGSSRKWRCSISTTASSKDSQPPSDRTCRAYHEDSPQL